MDNSSAKVHLCNQGGTASLFLSRLACHIFNITDKHGIIHILACVPTNLNMEANYISQGRLVPAWHLLPCIAQAAFHLLGQPEVDLLGSSCTNQCQCYYTLESPLTLGTLGLKNFNHAWTYQVSYMFPPAALVSLVLSKFPLDHVTSQFRFFILMEAPWLSTVFSMLDDIHHWFPIVNDLIMDVLVGWVLKGVQSLHLTLWLLRDVCCTDKGFLHQCDRQWQGQLTLLQQKLTSIAERNGPVGILQRVYQTIPLLPLNLLIFWFMYLGLDQLHTPLLIIILLFLPLGNLITTSL